MGAVRLLRRRIALLDAEHRPWAGGPGVPGLLDHAVSVLGARTDAPVDEPVDAAVADEITGSCRLLTTIAGERPDLVTGPLRRDLQQWTGTAPDPARFRPATRDAQPGAKPFHTGLFTSTAGPDGRGMWRRYLEQYGGSLFPPPWTTWDIPVPPAARVREVASARDAVALVEAYPALQDGRAHPDWPAVAADYDGVHMTLAAVAAIQGVPLAATAGPTMPAFWDVESTFWLSWPSGTS
jgi:hypothetical protein